MQVGLHGSSKNFIFINFLKKIQMKGGTVSYLHNNYLLVNYNYENFIHYIFFFHANQIKPKILEIIHNLYWILLLICGRIGFEKKKK